MLSKNGRFGKTGTILTVFLSSPSDVEEERQIVQRMITDINKGIAAKFGVTLKLHMWEQFRPAGRNAMTVIRERLTECDLFLMLFSRKFGSSIISNNETHSGAEEEFVIAQKLRSQSNINRPELFVYFKKVQDEETLKDPGKELGKVLKFKDKIKGKIFYKEYRTTEAFEPIVKDNIIEWLCEIVDYNKIDIEKENKRKFLNTFFDFGSENSAAPIAKLIYPPLHSSKTRREPDITHLLPYMVLEDFNAISKIDRLLTSIGNEKIKIITQELYDKKIDREANCIFFCLRNKVAEDLLNKNKEKCFEIYEEPDKVGKITRNENVFRWKRNNHKIIVKSPQSKYMYLQRYGKINTELNQGACKSVDFAILAKLPDPDAESLPEMKIYKTFYLFGLRGLGTWGAAWYLDHRWQDLQKHFVDPMVHQQLLRIQFSNYQIESVLDVSSFPQSYFDEQNSLEYIKRVLYTCPK